MNPHTESPTKIVLFKTVVSSIIMVPSCYGKVPAINHVSLNLMDLANNTEIQCPAT